MSFKRPEVELWLKRCPQLRAEVADDKVSIASTDGTPVDEEAAVNPVVFMDFSFVEHFSSEDDADTILRHPGTYLDLRFLDDIDKETTPRQAQPHSSPLPAPFVSLPPPLTRSGSMSSSEGSPDRTTLGSLYSECRSHRNCALTCRARNRTSSTTTSVVASAGTSRASSASRDADKTRLVAGEIPWQDFVAALRERMAQARAAGWIVSGLTGTEDGDDDSDEECARVVPPPARYEPLWPPSAAWCWGARRGMWPEERERRVVMEGGKGKVIQGGPGYVFGSGSMTLYDEDDEVVRVRS